MPQLKVRRGRRFTCLGLGLPFILVLAACDTATELQQNATKAMQSLGDLSGLASNEQETSSLPNIGGSALSACTSPSDRKWVSKTQEDLAYLGYKPGPATGDLTPQTEQALRDYLWHHGYLKWKIAGTSGQCNLTAVGYTELTSVCLALHRTLIATSREN